MATIDARQVITHVWSHKHPAGKIYALVDAARAEQIYAEIGKLAASEYHCLYEGQWAQDLAAVAPYLVELQQAADFTRTLLQQGWGKSWGIWLESQADINALLAHLRRLLQAAVQTDPPQRLYFRYYDPRVLRVYLDPTTSDETERGRLFGTVIQRYWLEQVDGQTLRPYPSTGPIPRPEESAIRVNAKQLAAYTANLMQEFEDHMVTHLEQFFSLQAQELGEAKMREEIRYGIQRAMSYGMVTSRDICNYINLMFTCGRDFDTDPALAWAHEILGTKETPAIKIARLGDAADTYFLER